MAAGKKKPVRWTIPDVKIAPPRAVEARRPEHSTDGPLCGYPSAAEMMARGPEVRAWLESAVCAIVQPVAVASALSLGATGCVDIGQLLGSDPTAAPVFAGVGPSNDKPATLTPIGSPVIPASAGGGVVMHPLPPDEPKPASIAPCPLPPLGSVGVRGEAPAVAPAPAVRPPVHPPALRGRIRPVRPPTPPPPLPAVDPPTLDGDVAMVHPEPPPMPGGPALVRAPGDGGTH
jgi:hypothetical protein